MNGSSLGILAADAANAPRPRRRAPACAEAAALEGSSRDGAEPARSAIRWAVDHAAELQADPQRIAAGGDSAGGNLAAAAINRLAADPAAPVLRAQLLLFPVTDHPGTQYPSYKENGSGYGLTAEAMQWYWGQYVQGTDPDAPEVSPLRQNALPQLPPTLLATAEYDVLRDEGIAYAEKLRGAGVAVTHLHAPDMHHDYPVSPGTVARFPQCLTTLSEIAGWLRATLGTPLPERIGAHAGEA